MKKYIVFVLGIIFMTTPVYAFFGGGGLSAGAIYHQTAVQTAEHVQRLAEAIKKVQLLQSQVQDTSNILQLAQEASRGLDRVGFVTDFRNVLVETGQIINDIEDVIATNGDISQQWKDAFGSLDPWLESSVEYFQNIDASDQINSNGYLIADSYQDIYKSNAQHAKQFIDHSKTVNEKGALKQIAQELAHLIEMENHVMYLMSQSLKTQTIENSNRNLERKEEVIRFEKENEGVRRFIRTVNADTFRM